MICKPILNIVVLLLLLGCFRSQNDTPWKMTPMRPIVRMWTPIWDHFVKTNDVFCSWLKLCTNPPPWVEVCRISFSGQSIRIPMHRSIHSCRILSNTDALSSSCCGQHCSEKPNSAKDLLGTASGFWILKTAVPTAAAVGIGVRQHLKAVTVVAHRCPNRLSGKQYPSV